MDISKMLTATEAAEYLRIPYHSLANGRRANGSNNKKTLNSPIYHKLGAKVYYKQEDLDKWLEDNMKRYDK